MSVQVKERVREGHPVLSMTPEARVEWYGMTPECERGQHDRCSGRKGTTHKVGYDVYVFPCGDACHYEEEA